MRKFKYDEIQKEKKELFLLDRKEKIRRKPRNKEEEKILDILLNSRVEKFFKEGMIKKIGRRKFKLRI